MATQGSLEIDLSVGPSVYATYKRMSYRIDSAINEFVDNSTQSFFANRTALAALPSGNTTLTINIVHDPTRKSLTIEDDAFGMERDEMIRAITLNSPPPDISGRSVYGMGLKMAACWMSKKWRVVTKQVGSEIEYDAMIDVDTLEHQNTNSIYASSRFGMPVERHYTRIEMTGLNRQIRTTTVANIQGKLASTYRRDIANGDVLIKWNGNIIPVYDNEGQVFESALPDGQLLRYERDLDFMVSNFPVKGKVWLRQRGAGHLSGIEIFWRNRLVQGGPNEGLKPHSIFGAATSYRSQTVNVELDLDDWPVSQSKDSILWDGGLREDLISTLHSEINEYLNRAEERVGHGKKGGDVTTQADGEVATDKVKDDLKNQDTTAAMVMVESGPLPDEQSERTEAEEVRQTIESALTSEPVIVEPGTNGRPQLKVYWWPLGAADVYAKYEMPDTDTIHLIINLDHPYVQNNCSRDNGLLSLFSHLVFADVLVEIGLNRRGTDVRPAAFRRMKDLHLRAIHRTSDWS